MSLSACLTCRGQHGQPQCKGPCPCPIDGNDIRFHVEAAYCPLPSGPRFGDALRPDGWESKPLPPAGAAPEPAPAPVAVPESEWPAIVHMVAAHRNDEDKGVGDTLARISNIIPIWGGMGLGDAFKAMFKAVGWDCGCADRQAKANARYPYPRTSPPAPAPTAQP
jgi:hypothetical protein